jgi:hypothetical protein
MPRQLCELKLTKALLKNHATALCAGSFTNTINTLCCPKSRFSFENRCNPNELLI